MKQVNILLKSNGGLKLDELNLNISLVFDDEFLFTDKAINKKASVLFGYKQHEEVLCGDVLVQKDIETPEGIIAVGFNEEEATVIEAYIENLKYEHIKFIKQEPCAKFIPF